MVRAEQWAFIHQGMAALHCCLKRRRKLDNSSLLVPIIGPKSSGWMFTSGALKLGRVTTGSSSTSKNVSPCVHPLSDSPFPAHPPFQRWHLAPGAWAKGTSGAKSSAAVPDCSLARAAMSLMFPSRTPLLSLDAALRGDATAPLSGVEEHPPPAQPPSREAAPGMGKRAEFLPFSG